MKQSNFDIVQNFIGWGDPKNSIWFFGIEEGATFDQETINQMKDHQHDPIEREDLNWPIANKTARILAALTDDPDATAYRDQVMWRSNSGSFNGNLLPLGKPSRTGWGHEYEELFGFKKSDQKDYIKSVRTQRYPKIQRLKDYYKPQAIICFGKEFWGDFEHIFVENPYQVDKYEEKNIKIFAEDKVIMTGHFSYGVHFPDHALSFVVDKLKEWGALPVSRRK